MDKKERPALPAPAAHTENWREKIQKAKDARMASKQQRAGKPATLPLRRSISK